MGWYVIEESKNLAALQVLSKKVAGKELVLYRTASGLACIADAFCPHMGGNFGFGGKVEGETIVCPFHHFCFDPNGKCTKTGYGTPPPPGAVLKVYSVAEKNGFIMFWLHSQDAAPKWEMPEEDQTDWTEIKTKEYILSAHPQEITENSVDLGHFSVVHKYKNVREIKAAYSDGPFLKGSYGFEREPFGLFGAASKGIKAEFDFFILGLGYSFVEVTLPVMQLKTRQYVLPLPIEENKTRILIGMSVNKKYSPAKIHPALQLFPRVLTNKLLLNVGFSGYANDVSQDFKIWENKTYLNHPALAKGDGPIGRYRMWAKQFYE